MSPEQIITESTLAALTEHTEAFLKTMYSVRTDFAVSPLKEHVATCINYSDLQEMRDEFVEELMHTAITFVYSPDKQQELLRTFAETRGTGAAMSKLMKRAHSKFRSSNLQGQFSELLLSNLLQSYYKAVPLLRKMAITTNPEVERHGADAIHVSHEFDRFKLYLGEAKTYNRKSDSLKDALVDAVKDAVNVHYPNHRNELDLYTCEDFLPPELEAIAQKYMDGSLEDIEVHLVCIATYDSKKVVSGKNRQEILDNIISGISQEAISAFQHPEFTRIPENLRPRMNYILFSLQDMNSLISDFKNALS